MFRFHVVLDFEMNPTDRKTHELKNEIIEIGAVKLNSDLKIVDRFRCYVKPQYSYQVTPYIYRLTGIHPTRTMSAESFEQSIKKLVEWIGHPEGIRVYSWSDNDLRQLRDECYAKGVEFPYNMRRWLDLQKVFPRIMCISKYRHRPMALREAVEYSGIAIDKKRIHDALYDSEITSEILVSILSGQFQQQLDCVYQYTHQSDKESSLGDICGGILSELLKQLQPESA